MFGLLLKILRMRNEILDMRSGFCRSGFCQLLGRFICVHRSQEKRVGLEDALVKSRKEAVEILLLKSNGSASK